MATEQRIWRNRAEIRIGRGYRDKTGKFLTSTYFSADALVVQMEQCLKALAFVKPELIESTMKSQDAMAGIEWRK
jgi:hypothetical protein